jgi:hypothetical protein
MRGRLPLRVLQHHAGLKAHHELFDPRHCRLDTALDYFKVNATLQVLLNAQSASINSSNPSQKFSRWPSLRLLALTVDEVPADGPPRAGLLVVDDEPGLAPDVALDPAGDAAPHVLGAAPGEPPGREHADGEPLDAAGGGVEVEAGAVVPLHVVERVGGELVADQVQVAPPRPVVVEVRDAERRARGGHRVVGQVGEHHRVEPLRPRRR